MIRKPNGSDAKRLGAGVLVAGMAAAGAVALASPASAATSGYITANASPTNNQAGSSTTVTYADTDTATGAVAGASVISQSGTGTVTFTAGNPSSTTTAPTYPDARDFAANGSFTVKDTGAGTVVVRVFDDANANSTFNAGENYTDLTLNYSSAPTNITQTPTTASTTANIYQNFTDTTTTGGNTSGNAPVTVTASETLPNSTTAPSLKIADASGTQQNASTTAGTPGPTTTTYTATATFNTDSNGSLTFGVTSNTAGTVSVSSDAGSGVSASSTLTVTSQSTGDNSVSNLSASSNTSGTTGGTASFTVTATDSNGNPVSGASVYYQITSGPDQTAAGNYPPCSGNPTSTNGTVTCSIQNGGTAGTDNITFFVNNTTGNGTHTPGPDAGDPKTTATATFTAPAEVDTVTVDSSNGHTVPSGTTPLTYTATVTTGNANTPVSGVAVTFSITETDGANATPVTTTRTATTNAQGVATTSVSPTSTAAGTTVSVTAKDANSQASGAYTTTYVARTATTFTLAPAVQTVQTGSSVSVTATVQDQYGQGVAGQSIGFTVAGRNTGKSQTITTGSGGTATFTYTDTGVNSSSTQDTVSAVDNSTPNLGAQSAEVDYVADATPSYVTVSPSTNNVDVSNQATTEETATITNGSSTNAGTALANVPVTFTVNSGFVSATEGTTASPSNTATKSVTVYTDQNGQASVYVGSTSTATQTLTATAGQATGTATITYQAGNFSMLVLTPSTAAVPAGGSQKFTATAEDQYGNTVSQNGGFFFFSSTGPGVLNNSGYVYTINGQASVLLTVPSGSTGSGTVTAQYEYDSSTAQTSTYMVTGGQATTITVAAGSINPVLQTSTVTATAKDSSGNPVSGVLLSFAGTGANTPSGTATTGTNGTATFSFKPYHKGATKITATDSADNVSGSVTVTIPQGNVTNQLSQATPLSGRVRMFDYPSVGGAGVQVNFYQVISPTQNKLLGSAKTDSTGRAYFQASGLKSGSKFTGVARSVYNTANFANRYSNEVTTTVK